MTCLAFVLIMCLFLITIFAYITVDCIRVQYVLIIYTFILYIQSSTYILKYICAIFSAWFVATLITCNTCTSSCVDLLLAESGRSGNFCLQKRTCVFWAASFRTCVCKHTWILCFWVLTKFFLFCECKRSWVQTPPRAKFLLFIFYSN